MKSNSSDSYLNPSSSFDLLSLIETIQEVDRANLSPKRKFYMYIPSLALETCNVVLDETFKSVTIPHLIIVNQRQGNQLRNIPLELKCWWCILSWLLDSQLVMQCYSDTLLKSFLPHQLSSNQKKTPKTCQQKNNCY